MTQPAQHARDIMHFRARGQGGPVDHDHRQAKPARRLQFGIGAGAAGVLGHDQFYPVGLHQGAVSGFGEGAAIDDDMGLRQGQGRLRRIDKAQQIVVMRHGREIGQMLATNGQHDAARGLVERGHGGGNVGDMLPGVAGFWGPGRAGEGEERDGLGCAGGDGVMAHLGGERVGRVDHMGDGFAPQVIAQALHAAETADALGQGLAQRALDPACKRERSLYPALGQGGAKLARFGRAAEDEKVLQHG